ncbi:MAG: hypothetical protein HOO96_37520 [Polyangiaceae bacterium]|nr:hypothetical protein [Polyangiaceae bacterium]
MHLAARLGLPLVALFPLACSASPEETADADLGGVSQAQTALPTQGELRSIAVAPSGARLFASNNPETITGYGILAATVLPGSLSGGSRADTATFGGLAAAPKATMVGSASLDASCPAGYVRSAEVYVAHIMKVPGYVALGVVSDTATTIEITGSVDAGAWAQLRSPSFVSAAAARDHFFGSPAPRSVSVPAKQYVQLGAANGGGGVYVDGRLSLRSTSGCFAPYVVAQRQATASSVPTTLAQGNVAWPGWYKGGGAGRSSGMYAGDHVRGQVQGAFTKAGQSFGYRIGTTEQSVPAVLRLADSSAVDFGNYGVMYELTGKVDVSGADCLDIDVELVSYVDVKPQERPTWGVVNALGYVPKIYWNGPYRAKLGDAAPVSGDAVLYADKNPGMPADQAVPTLRHRIGSLTGIKGGSKPFEVALPVPGMITVPLGLVLTSKVSKTCGSSQQAVAPVPDAGPRPDEADAKAPPTDTCSGKADGFYCSILAPYSGYYCVAQHVEYGLQCFQPQKCVGLKAPYEIACR